MSLAIPRHGGTAEAPAGTILPGLRVAAAASLGAGAIHAAATGIHAAHIGLARLFIIFAAAQLVAGALALLRPNRLVAWAVAVVNAVAVGGWALTRVTGISWIDGLQVRESPQFADVVCAGLGALAVAGAVAAIVIGWQDGVEDDTGRATLFSAIPIVAIAALAVPAMLTGGTTAHAHDTTAAAAHDHGASPSGGDTGAAPAAAAGGHDHGATGDSVTTTTFDESQPHTHDAGGNAVPVTTTPGELATDGTPVRAWPRPWDPSQPIDVGGVQGVSTVQEARATQLIQGTLADLPKYADPAAAVADGYASIGDGATGSEHYIKSSLIEDDDMLDPAAPESLVYDVKDGTKTLAGAMYIVSARPLDDPSLTDYAGPLMTWHEHNNLCWGVGADGKPKVVGLTDANGNCANGVKAGGDNPMVHVWILPRACGVFSALEGVGEGNAAVPQDQRTDTCAAAESAHTHGTSDPTSTSTAAAVPSLAYDPTKPIDLGGVAGVTPEQQAAAENLVAINVVRLPQWADYHTAEAAGYHSIGDAGTGFEHFIDWDLINDQDWLDPDHPESLVYTPQADGSKKLVSAMYMLPSTVALTDVPDIGGKLMQWHIHDNLCFTTDPVAPQVVGLTKADGTCAAGLQKLPTAPMIHVWIVPNACGPFAALEGVGAGQVAAGETTQCDHVHGDGAGLLG